MSSAIHHKLFWIYILECENGSFYTGYTTDLARRFKEHCDGTYKCKYTRSFKVIRILQSWKIQGTQSQVLRVEKFIKKIAKTEKKKLIAHPELLAHFFHSNDPLNSFIIEHS